MREIARRRRTAKALHADDDSRNDLTEHCSICRSRHSHFGKGTYSEYHKRVKGDICQCAGYLRYHGQTHIAARLVHL